MKRKHENTQGSDIASSLLFTVRNAYSENCINVIKNYIKTNPAVLNQDSPYIFNNIFHAIAENKSSIAPSLIKIVEDYMTVDCLSLYRTYIVYKGYPPLMLAINNENYQVAFELIQSQERMLRKFGYSEQMTKNIVQDTINMSDLYDQNFLHISIRKLSQEQPSIGILEELLKLDINLNAVDYNGNTPAHRLITKTSFDKYYKKSNVEILSIKLENLCNTLKLLKKYGANLEIPNHNGQTIFDLLLENSKFFGFIWTDQHTDAILENRPIPELAKISVQSIADRISIRRNGNIPFVQKITEPKQYSNQTSL
ncbi:Ankyrin repeat protein [Rickettsiales bacterium Ac37b]|nr:Ankyrin repeat protein [Rickettsiales bacterium Ac37b]